MTDLAIQLPEANRRLDAIDRKILTVLQEDASLSVAEIGDRVGLSSTPCWKRIQRLEADGVILRRVALVDQNNPVGAAGRCAACAVLHPRVRPPPRLAGVFAAAADRIDPAAGADGSGAFAAVRRARRAAGGDHVVHPGHRGRCVSRREPARERTGRRHGVLCRGLSDRHADLHRGRAVHRQRIRGHRHHAQRGVDVGLCGNGRAGADRHDHGPRRDRARTIRARRSRDRRGERVYARGCMPQSGLSRNFSSAKTLSRRSPSSCCSSSPTRFPAP